MKARPILFSGPMVRALREGRKSQTRRIVKDFKIARVSSRREFATSGPHQLSLKETPGYAYVELADGRLVGIPCPYGQPGDLLWVRETWCGAARYGYDAPEDGRPGVGDDDSVPMPVWYRATDDVDSEDGWRPSIFMPRWASRLTLRIKAVRVERLQEISEEDAKAEGIIEQCSQIDAGWRDYWPSADAEPYATAIEAYLALWKSINGPDSWSANPWVWVIEFDVINANIDTIKEAA